MTEVEVVRPGILMTVQDLGRGGQGRFGVSPAGAMDPLALRVGNRLLGNADGAAALEVTGGAAELAFSGAVAFAITGADLSARLDGQSLALWTAVVAKDGARLQFGHRVRGARAIVAFAGGLDADRILGSASTDLDAGLGSGRLARGARLRVRAPANVDAGGVRDRHGDSEVRGRQADPEVSRDLSLVMRAYDDPFRLRFVPVADPALDVAAFCAASYQISDRSNRTGYRLTGPRLAVAMPADRLSLPLAPGTIQVPPDGQPILLMADRQTIGGYPCIGHLIAADRAKAAQLWPGDQVQFVAVSLDEAHRAAREQAAFLDAL